MSYTITYNNINPEDLGVFVVQRPNIPAPQLRINETIIEGRDGSLITTDGCFDNIEIAIQLNYMSPKDDWKSTFRKIKSWLLARNGERRLVLSDDTRYFYKVKNVIIGENERTSYRIGVLTPIFLCEPFEYLESGTDEYEIEDVKLNPYYMSKPIYKITGEGVCTLTVNGNEMTANVGQNLTIDTGLMIAYREDGMLQNTAVKGDYEGLYLNTGENQINIDGNVSLKIIPNWRCL